MARLDTFLVEKGLILSRSRAKRAIIYGLIKLNGVIIQKPSHHVKSSDQIEILSEFASKPAGYWKLSALVQTLKTKILTSTDIILDLGSSAGGFLEYAAEHCKKVFGIEFSPEFAPQLHQLADKYPNITVTIADLFQLDHQHIPGIVPVDLILNDLTLAPAESINILSKFLPILKKDGYILMAVKQGKSPVTDFNEFLLNIDESLNLEVLQVIDLDPDKKEFHFLAKKTSNGRGGLRSLS